ncbi:sensor domain-containing diguanylate cyclase [Clostridium thermarum]|uniref:sensor domain-containing diguanylate cyclase n=1 Tax=Clostridium thermarum TaxID=1716543 RepID=UPI001FAA9B80|nr:sensor domain-containing diguanylate cyclase [Clostridium thermarum]
MSNYKELYEQLLKEYGDYVNFSERNYQMAMEKIIRLEKSLDAMANIIEVSKYINSYLGDENLIPMINDMILGILGVSYSSIYIKEEDTIEIRATNKSTKYCYYVSEEKLRALENHEPFIINSENAIYESENGSSEIHSLIGVPIHLRDKFIGYFIVEHTLWNFFSDEHIKFITSIANQIAIALENNFLYNKVRESSIKDPLMGIFNRRYFFDRVSNIIKTEKDKKFAVVMMDMDYFKKVNDIYGHPFGDEVLKQIAELVHDSIDINDIVARYGGEELVIYLDRVETFSAVYEKIEEIRRKISLKDIEYGGQTKRNTASFGISFYPEDGKNLEEILGCADDMLYKAKEMGRNIVVSSRS